MREYSAERACGMERGKGGALEGGGERGEERELGVWRQSGESMKVCSESESEMSVMGVEDGGEGLALGLRVVRRTEWGFVTRPWKMATERAGRGAEAAVLLERRVGMLDWLNGSVPRSWWLQGGIELS